MYDIPWNEFDTSKKAAEHALKTAFEYVERKQFAYAALGGPELLIGSERGKLLKEIGIEILQIAGCEVFENIEIWRGVFNGILLYSNDTNYIHGEQVWGLVHHYSIEYLKELIELIEIEENADRNQSK